MTLNTSTNASTTTTGTQPAPGGAAAAGTPAAAPTKGVFGNTGISLEKLGYPGKEPKANAAPADGKPAQPAPAAAAPAALPDGAKPPEVGEPGTDGKPPAALELVAENGRKFTSHDELLKTYNESGKEAKRLADSEKTNQFTISDQDRKLTEANKTILAMQEYIGAGTYPNTKTPDELAAMDDEAKQDYYADKRDWKKRVEGFKTQMEGAKAESEKAAAALKEGQERTRLSMKNDPDNFPGFGELEPNVNKVLVEVPELTQLPNAPYLAYFIAMGDTYLTYLHGVSKTQADAVKAAAEQASAAATAAGGAKPQQAAGGTGSGAPKPNEDDPIARASKAYKAKSKVF